MMRTPCRSCAQHPYCPLPAASVSSPYSPFLINGTPAAPKLSVHTLKYPLRGLPNQSIQIVSMRSLQYDLRYMPQTHGNLKWPFSLVGVFAQLLSAQASEYQNRVYTCCNTSTYIGDAVANKDGIVHVNAQLITSAE